MKQFFSKITPKYDKLKHLYIGTLLFIGLSVLLPKLTALLITALVAILVEVVYDDLMKKSTPEIMDVFWSIIFPILITFLL